MKTINDLKFKYSDPNNLNYYPKEVIDKLLHKFLPLTLKDYIENHHSIPGSVFSGVSERSSIGEVFINKIDDDFIYFNATINNDDIYEILNNYSIKPVSFCVTNENEKPIAKFIPCLYLSPSTQDSSE